MPGMGGWEKREPVETMTASGFSASTSSGVTVVLYMIRFGGNKMDTFMERLAEKFTAQELIKANETAEKEEMDRLRAQVQEYTECLDRMKQICADMEQTADAAKGKVEAAQLNTAELKDELLKMWEDMQAADAQRADAAQNSMAQQTDDGTVAKVAEQLTAQLNAQSVQVAGQMQGVGEIGRAHV